MVTEHKPSKLSPHKRASVTKTIKELLRKGHRREQAFIRAGISASTMYNWWKHYNEEVEAGLEDTVLINFWTEILEAEAESEADIVDILRNKALNGDGKSAMYMLDKRYGWANKQEIELSTKDDSTISIEFVDMVDKFGNKGENDGEATSGTNSDSEEVYD